MKPFDVFHNPAPDARGYAPYIVVLSSHFLPQLEDVVVAPLVNDAEHQLSGLEIETTIDGERLTLIVAELSSLRARYLRHRVGSLDALEFDIRRALDRLFTGF